MHASLFYFFLTEFDKIIFNSPVKMSKIKKTNLLNHEQELIDKYKNNLSAATIDISKFVDWRDGEYISHEVYEKITESSVLIGMTENLTIKTAKTINKDEFKTILEKTATKRILDLKKQNKFILSISGTLFFIGIIFLVISGIGIFKDVSVVNEIFLIFSWVFIWTSIEKFVFERKEIKHQRLKLVYICNSKIV